MSVHKWAYTPEKCEGDYCVGDCDLCTKAKHPTGCTYPECEDCEKYVETADGHFCTVPIIVSKQMWLMTTDRLNAVEKRISQTRSALWQLWSAAMDAMEQL